MLINWYRLMILWHTWIYYPFNSWIMWSNNNHWLWQSFMQSPLLHQRLYTPMCLCASLQWDWWQTSIHSLRSGWFLVAVVMWDKSPGKSFGRCCGCSKLPLISSLGVAAGFERITSVLDVPPLQTWLKSWRLILRLMLSWWLHHC